MRIWTFLKTSLPSYWPAISRIYIRNPINTGKPWATFVVHHLSAITPPKVSLDSSYNPIYLEREKKRKNSNNPWDVMWEPTKLYVWILLRHLFVTFLRCAQLALGCTFFFSWVTLFLLNFMLKSVLKNLILINSNSVLCCLVLQFFSVVNSRIWLFLSGGSWRIGAPQAVGSVQMVSFPELLRRAASSPRCSFLHACVSSPHLPCTRQCFTTKSGCSWVSFTPCEKGG